MTTLPQTTPMRLPRPVAPSQLAMPVGVAPAVHAGANPMTGGDIWRMLRANAWLIGIIVGSMLALGVVANTWLASKHPRFTATGLIQVHLDSEFPQRPGEIRVSGGASSQEIEIEQHDQVSRIKQPSLLMRVLRGRRSGIRSGSRILSPSSAANPSRILAPPRPISWNRWGCRPSPTRAWLPFR